MTRTSFERHRINVLLLEGIHPSAVDRFEHAGYTNVTRLDRALQGKELTAAVDGVHILGIRSRTQLDAGTLDGARRLMSVGCFCIGTNQVDLPAMMRAGIPVFNAPFSNTRSVAELVLAEAILLLRGVPGKSASLVKGEWRKGAADAFEARGKTLGVIGYGNIGAQLGVLAEALGMRVIFHDVVTKLKLGNARQVNDLDTLLSQADVVSLHVPATPNLITAERIERMKPTAVLINASRGNVVDLDALAAALKSGRLLGAAIDVYPAEPGSNDEPFDSPLIGAPNVILTPHIGGSTVEAQENIGTEVAEKLIRYSDNGSTLSAVNFPEVALPAHADKHRLLHIHRNVPGVMNEINAIFSEMQVNVAAQYLQTTPEIGYVVVDIDSEYSRAIRSRIEHVRGTIRTRVLF